MNKRTLWLVELEPLENRYTKHWWEFLPEQLEMNCPGFNVEIIEAPIYAPKAEQGAFLDFTSTVKVKANQIEDIAARFDNNEIRTGDVFLYTDAWNPTVTMLKYMAGLRGIKITTIGIWHAGNYDPNDLLGQTFRYDRWIKNLEYAMADSFDINVFATKYHANLASIAPSAKKVVVGFPMEYYSRLEDFQAPITPWGMRENIIVFPHRIAKEKRPQDFEKLQEYLYGRYEFVYTQEVCSNKEEYHTLLRKSKFAFSAADQETLGISMYEAALLGCMPIVPDRLSYKEMWSAYIRYSNLEEAVKDINKIDALGLAYPTITALNLEEVKQKFFTGTELYKLINNV